MFNWLKKSSIAKPLMAPVKGIVIPLSESDDPVFAGKMIGDGFGIEPSVGAVVSPASGVVTMIAPTLHGIGIKTDDGLDLLLHMGIDTVALKGTPFTMKVAVDQRVESGQALALMDLTAVQKAGKSTTIMVVITNTAERGIEVTPQVGAIDAGETAATYTVKS